MNGESTGKNDATGVGRRDLRFLGDRL